MTNLGTSPSHPETLQVRWNVQRWRDGEPFGGSRCSLMMVSRRASNVQKLSYTNVSAIWCRHDHINGCVRTPKNIGCFTQSRPVLENCRLTRAITALEVPPTAARQHLAPAFFPLKSWHFPSWEEAQWNDRQRKLRVCIIKRLGQVTLSVSLGESW